MKIKCRDCGRSMYMPGREVIKERRYDEYEELLAKAMEAAAAAYEDYDKNLPSDYKADHGRVWISLDDGRSSFARFIQARHPGLFTFWNRRSGCSYLVSAEDYRAAIAYAMAFREVLAEGGIGVTVVSVPIERGN